jgi:hypothetical protein
MADRLIAWLADKGYQIVEKPQPSPVPSSPEHTTLVP